MKRVRESGTAPELAVRRIFRELGVSYRLNVRGLPGRPDLANRRRRFAVFVHGCFWHGHNRCKLATMPGTNTAFWMAKFESNRARDRRNILKLREGGFKVLTVWQCELDDVVTLKNRISTFVRDLAACSDFRRMGQAD